VVPDDIVRPAQVVLDNGIVEGVYDGTKVLAGSGEIVRRVEAKISQRLSESGKTPSQNFDFME
jgi:hypothetical protein